MSYSRFALLAALLLIFGKNTMVSAQSAWQQTLKSPQVFIENKGQYDALSTGFSENGSYVMDHGFGWQVLLGNKGIHYLVQRMDRDADAADEETAEGGPHGEIRTSRISMEFVGALPNVQPIALEEQPDYYSYAFASGDEWIPVNEAHAYARLTYPNLYPGIDAEVVGKGDRGLKYSFLVHPGASAGQIRLRWTGAVPRLDAQGDLHLPAVLGEIVDQHPIAFYADEPSSDIPVHFVLVGNEVTFSLDTYDTQRAIVIDPWSINPALPAPFNRAFEVDVDASNNVYVFGGGMGYNLKKYNSAGVLQWTHVSPWDTSTSWFGELLTTAAGDCFISSGSVAKLRRVTTAGATVWTNNGPFFNNDEYWTMVLNCDGTKLVCGGTRLVGLSNPRAFLFNINMTNGNQLAGSPYQIEIGCSAAFPGGCEVREFATGADGYMYAVSNDTIWRVNNTFGVNNKIAHGKALPYNSPTYLAKNVQGINGIDIGSTYSYINWGNLIEKRNNANGALVSSVANSGTYTSGFFGTGPNCSGMVVDNCGNVFVGTPSTIVKYDANLTNLGNTAVASAVYDMVISPSGALIVGGNGFVASVTALASCGPKVVVCPVLSADVTTVAATCAAGRAKIEWNTAHEDNCKYFVVEKSVNEGAFEAIGQVEAKGSPTSPSKYVFFDPALTIDPGSLHLYRVQAFDLDGRSEPSAMVTLQPCSDFASEMQVYPAYAHHNVHLAFPHVAGNELTIVASDQVGKRVLEASATPSQGENNIELDLGDAAAGVYFIQVTNHQGWTATGKVVKE